MKFNIGRYGIRFKKECRYGLVNIYSVDLTGSNFIGVTVELSYPSKKGQTIREKLKDGSYEEYRKRN